jgi:hypothetical protein
VKRIAYTKEKKERKKKYERDGGWEGVRVMFLVV